MTTTEKLLLQLFEGTDNFDYKILNQNWEKIENAIKELSSGGVGISPTITIQEIENGYRITITDAVKSQSIDLFNGEKGDQGDPGVDGFTPHIKNGDWWIGGTNTGVAAQGANGKSAYEYAKDGGFTGTENEFAEQIAKIASIAVYAGESEDVG